MIIYIHMYGWLICIYIYNIHIIYIYAYTYIYIYEHIVELYIAYTYTHTHNIIDSYIAYLYMYGVDLLQAIDRGWHDFVHCDEVTLRTSGFVDSKDDTVCFRASGDPRNPWFG